MKRRTTTLFALGDWYDHEKAYKYKFHVMETHRKFLEALKSLSSLEKTLFLNLPGRVEPVLEYEFSKIDICLRFRAVESDLSIV